MTTSLMPEPRQRYYTNLGSVAAGCKLYTYAAGTTTPKATYTDAAGLVPHTNPITLDTKGEAVIYWDGAYKVDLKTATGVQITGYPVDNFISVDAQIAAAVGSLSDAINLLRTDLAAQTGAEIVGSIEPGAGSVARTVQSRLADFLSVKDKGAVGDGVADDTAEIDLCVAQSDSIYFPDGTYLYTGDITALFEKSLFGGGSVRYAGYDYPVARRDALNVLWPGEFRNWAMGHALGVETTQRRQIPAGVTNARLNFAAGVTISHVEGTWLEDAVRIQRNAGTVATDSYTKVINLTREETKAVAGKSCVLQFNGLKGADYSGGNITYRVQYSNEPEQPIINADGTFTNVNVNLSSASVALATTARADAAPYYAKFDVPAEASQVAVVFVVPFAGTAGTDDYIELEGVSVHAGEAVANILRESFSALSAKAATRFQASYPYGAPRGVVSEQGAESAIAINTAVNWAFSMDVRFNPRMAVAPQFIFQSPGSSTESKLLNKDAAASVNGLAFNLSDSGVTITNNAVAVAGNRYLCHWTAQAIF